METTFEKFRVYAERKLKVNKHKEFRAFCLSQIQNSKP